MLIAYSLRIDLSDPEAFPSLERSENPVLRECQGRQILSTYPYNVPLKCVLTASLGQVQHTVLRMDRPVYLAYVFCWPENQEAARRQLVAEVMAELKDLAQRVQAAHTTSQSFFARFNLL